MPAATDLGSVATATDPIDDTDDLDGAWSTSEVLGPDLYDVIRARLVERTARAASRSRPDSGTDGSAWVGRFDALADVPVANI